IAARGESTMANGMFDDENENTPPRDPAHVVDYQPPSADETNRQSSLAWSAGIVFFSSIAFMLFLGWLADWLLGSSPWGMVGGIVIGSIIGFIQFFRLSSQIFNPEKTKASLNPLMHKDDEED